MQCNALNGTLVKDVKDIKIHVLFVICNYWYISERPQTGGTGVGTVWEDLFRGQCRRAALTAPVFEDTYDIHPNSNPNDLS